MSEVAQLCPTLCDLMDCSLLGSFIHGIFQARILEEVAVSYSRDLSNPGIEPESLVSPALAGGFFIIAPPGKPRFLLFFQVANTECFYTLHLDNTTECKNYLFKHIYVCVI